MSLWGKWLKKPSPRETFEKASSLSKEGRHLEAFASFAAAAKAGHAESQFQIAQRYFEGLGVPRSDEEGLIWLRAAAEGGFVDAQVLLGSMLLNQPASASDVAPEIWTDSQNRSAPDFRAAMVWARRASEQGSPKGDALLAYILSTGPEELRRTDLARRLYKRSAEARCPEGALGYALILAGDVASETTVRELYGHLKFAADSELDSAIFLLAQFHDQQSGQFQDKAASVDLYRRAAERGLAAAQYRYGRALLDGDHCVQDALMGETWLRRAAQSGFVEAAFCLGEHNSRGTGQAANYAEAARWYLIAAEGGHADAARALSSLYLTGAGVGQDRLEAARWLAVAGAAGDLDSQLEVGNSLLAGQAVGIEEREVAHWFAKAASSGNMAAAYNVAVCLANGVGLEKDERRAAAWMRHAAKELPDAQYIYGRMLADGHGVDEDQGLARQYFWRAAKGGSADAQIALAEMLLNGRGGPKDVDSAKALFERAARREQVGAMYALGVLASGTEGGQEDAALAVKWFQAAAARGHVDAQYAVGHCTRTGLGCVMDLQLAQSWFSRAAEQGHEEAELALAEMREEAAAVLASREAGIRA